MCTLVILLLAVLLIRTEWRYAKPHAVVSGVPGRPGYAAIYYTVFRVLIRKLNLKHRGVRMKRLPLQPH